MIRLEGASTVHPTLTRPALDRVRVDVDRREFVFLIGVSCSDESTVLRLPLREDVPRWVMALVKPPGVLITDEPVGNLDPATSGLPTGRLACDDARRADGSER